MAYTPVDLDDPTDPSSTSYILDLQERQREMDLTNAITGPASSPAATAQADVDSSGAPKIEVEKTTTSFAMGTEGNAPLKTTRDLHALWDGSRHAENGQGAKASGQSGNVRHHGGHHGHRPIDDTTDPDPVKKPNDDNDKDPTLV